VNIRSKKNLGFKKPAIKFYRKGIVKEVSIAKLLLQEKFSQCKLSNTGKNALNRI